MFFMSLSGEWEAVLVGTFPGISHDMADTEAEAERTVFKKTKKMKWNENNLIKQRKMIFQKFAVSCLYFGISGAETER